jgi:ubiquitin C-terminal hydrolase
MAKYMGFKNIGNTCYHNSGLQMLIQNKDFCQIILDNRDISKNMKTMSDFIDEYYNSKNSSITPNEIKRFVEAEKPIFKGTKQQDSFEFIIALMEILSKDLKNESINEVFNIEMNNTIKCKRVACLKMVNSREKTPFLILPIEDNSETNKIDFKDLDDCYRGIKTHQKLEGDDKYFCENCQRKVIASKRVEVTKWSNHLIICLSRFSKKNNNLSKNNKEIEIPQDWRHNFKIKGAVIQNGDLSGGHYFYISKNQETGKWTEYNDDSTSTITESRAQNLLNKAYLLHYKK